MKIAITGAHRTGKTTLANHLAEALPNFEWIPEPYYQLEESGHLFSEIPSIEDYILQLKFAINQLANTTKNLIFDRCPIDFLAYIYAGNGAEGIDFPTLYQKTQHAVSELDLLVFVPIEESDTIGCPELELPELRTQVNELISDWIWDFEVEGLEVWGTPSARREQVMKHISKKGI